MYGSSRAHQTAEAVARFLSWVYAKSRGLDTDISLTERDAR
jgi:hypothetical protein